MLTELCQELHNWFVLEKHFGKITISDGTITFADGTDHKLQNGQYFRIVGSVFNDGVHKYWVQDADDALTNEVFNGAVWALGIPKAVIALADEIGAWRDKYEGAESAAMSPFNSESFGGYSYSKAGAGTSNGSGSGGGWQGVFAARLNMWRKI